MFASLRTSLLFRNQSLVWPEFEGKDLSSRYSRLAFVQLATDGATTYDFLDARYLDLVLSYADRPCLVTLTVGGNDLLTTLWKEDDKASVEAEQVTERIEKVVDLIAANLPRAILMLTSIYDPTDGSGIIPGFPAFTTKLPLLAEVNSRIREIAERRGMLFADAHEHFSGHGLSSTAEPLWYWVPNPIGPSARGASELRALGLEALDKEDLV